MLKILVRVLCATTLVGCVDLAQTQATESPATETVLKGLTNPCSLVVRPGGTTDHYEIVIADSGAARIIRTWSHKPGESEELITGFDTSEFREDSTHVGPLGILFLDRNLLLVGASANQGHATLRLYDLSASAPKKHDQYEQKIELRSSGLDSSPDLQHIYALARTAANDLVRDGVVFTTFANEGSGAVWKLPLRAGTLGDAAQINSESHDSLPGVPAAISISDRGYVVVGSADWHKSQAGANLTFINPIDGSCSMQLTTELHGITALAYSPTTSALYAIGFSGEKPGDSSLYRIDDASTPGKVACKAIKVVDLKRASAMAFTPDGDLYVTTWGDAKEKDAPSGTLLTITENL